MRHLVIKNKIVYNKFFPTNIFNMSTEEMYIEDQHNNCESSCAGKGLKWDVPQLLNHQPPGLGQYAVLILNRPLTQRHSFVLKIWNNATIRMTIDGGTRQWDKFLNDLPEDMRKNVKLPDLITGDFDSITDEILEKYKKKGCKAIQTPDQNYTDFTKALIELNVHSHAVGKEMEHVLAFSQCCGRLDQMIANIQTLFLARDKRLLNPNTRVYLITDDAISWLLNPGDHTIDIPLETRKHKRAWCSLVPIGETCQYVTSTGLKWNLDHQPLKFGEIVSTSNTFDGSKTVTVSCTHTLLWSMRIPGVMNE